MVATAAVALLAGTAGAQEPDAIAAQKLGPQGQVILNPQPDFGAPSPVQRALEGYAALEPSAGPAAAGEPSAGSAAADCPQPEGWQVVVVRGGQAPDVVRGHMITVVPPGC